MPSPDVSRFTAGTAAAVYYKDLGWVMVPIQRGVKGPNHKGWYYEERCVVVPDWAGNVGLVHAHSGTCAIDVDNVEYARGVLKEAGIDLDALFAAPDAVHIIGNPQNHAKLLYRMPLPLVSVKWKVGKKDVLNFRCEPGYAGSQGVQDVIPPSIHPDTGMQYRWGGSGDFRALPVIPAALFNLWVNKLEERGPSASYPSASRGQLVERHEDWESEREEAVDALAHIDPDVDRETWVVVGMALQEAGGIWEDYDAWSARGSKYVGPEDTLTRWNSFHPERALSGGVSRATLFKMARDNGWVQPAVRERLDALAALDTAFTGVPGFGPPLSDAAPVSIAPPPLPFAAPEKVARERAEYLLSTLTHGSSDKDVEAIIYELATTRRGELEVDGLVKAIADRTQFKIKTIEVTYRKAVRAAAKTRRGLHQDNGDELGSKLAKALVTLSHDLSSDPQDFPALASRYVYVTSEGRFFDRLSCHWLTEPTINAAYAHLGWNVARNEGVLSNEGRSFYADDGDQAKPPSAAQALLQSQCCVKVDAADYWPGRDNHVYADNGLLVFNSWRKDGVALIDGDVTPWLEHLAWLIPDPRQRQHLICHMAFTLRHQDVKINHGVLLGGMKRIGKDTLIKPLLDALGPTNFRTVPQDRLSEPYEDFIEKIKLVVFNELYGSGLSTRKLENKLKPYLAAPPDRLYLRRLGDKPTSQRNLLAVYAQTNYRAVISLETSEERWFCVWCAPDKARDADYYKGLHDWLLSGGSSHVGFYLMNRVDISAFNPSAKPPATEWGDQLCANSEHVSPLQSLLEDLIASKAGVFVHDLVRLSDVVSMLSASDQCAGLRVNQSTVSSALTDIGCISSGRINYKPQAEPGKEKPYPKKVGLIAVRNLESWAKEKSGAKWIAWSEDERKVFSGSGKILQFPDQKAR